jgi:hypothetical protein
MPVLINIAANLLLGAAAVLAVPRSPALRAHFLSWQLLFVTAFEAVVVTPISTYLFRFYPQWSMLYLFDPQLYPDLERWVSLLSALVIALNFAALVGGYAVARHGLLHRKRSLQNAPLVAGGLIIAFTLLFFGDRIALLGDFDAFWTGGATFSLRRLAGWIGLSMYAAAAGYVLWVRRRFQRHDPSIL